MAKNVFVVLQQREGRLHRMSREAIAGGQILANLLGVRAEVVVLGGGLGEIAGELESRDLAAVHLAEDAKLADYTPGGYCAALRALLSAAAPDFVLFPHTYQSVDYVPRLAQELGAGYLPEVIGFDGDAANLAFRRPILGGKLVSRVQVKGSGTMLVTLQAACFSADTIVAGNAPVQRFDPGLAGVMLDREILGIEQVGGDQVDLTKAESIVAVGRGIGGADKMPVAEALAKALGADLGASRPVIDNGWLPRDRQIGSSGQTVAPKLYVALGISGAIQHLVGMKGSSVVVAINKDAGAPIFNVASYGIVGDLHEIVPALTAAVLEAKAGG
jgi:electron transfer flavoprotein alpha subunit